MIYVFDSSSLIRLGHFFPSRFPSLWAAIDSMVRRQTLVSVKEVYRELSLYAETDSIANWAERSKHIFLPPDQLEARFVASIFAISHFHALISKQSMLEGKPVADPFVVAAAKHYPGIVITEEILRPHAARIPNICVHFRIPYMNLESFMDREGLTY